MILHYYNVIEYTVYTTHVVADEVLESVIYFKTNLLLLWFLNIFKKKITFAKISMGFDIHP